MKLIELKNIFSYKTLYWAYILILGFVFIFLVPPFQKPDSGFHYYNAYSVLSNGCVYNSGSDGYMNIPKDVYEFPDKLFKDKIAFHYQYKFPKSLLDNKYLSSSKEFVIFKKECVKFGLISYLPNIIGLKIGGSNLLVGFYLSRLVGFLIFLCMLIVSINIVGKYYPLVIAFSVIPMVIHQVTAVSYDSFHISLGLLSFSLYLYLRNNFKKVRPFILFVFLDIFQEFRLRKYLLF